MTPGTLVIVSGRHFGRVVRAKKQHGAPGYDVDVPPDTSSRGGWAPHWAPGYCVQVAQIGVNVCRTPRGRCFCGLVHIPHPEWLEAIHR